MSEQNPVDDANASTEPTTDGTEALSVEELQEQLAQLTADRDKWKGLSRKHEAEAKAKKVAPAPASADDSDPTSAIAEIRAELAAAKREALVNRIAAAKGVPAELLSGDDEDALTESADRLLEFAKGAGKVTPPANDAGASGKTGEPVGGPRQLTREDLRGMSPQDIVKARAEGRLKHLGIG